jgi:hypothetical protein
MSNGEFTDTSLAGWCCKANCRRNKGGHA